MLRLLLLAAVVACAAAFAASRGEGFDALHVLGLVYGLALIAGFIALYVRESRRHPEWDEEEDRSRILGIVVLKAGCLVLTVSIVSAVGLALLMGGLEQLR